MDQISQSLIALSDQLDKQGKIKCANAIDGLIAHQSLSKVAQYVGAIGYVLKQNRAMGNCIRKKRAASSDTPIQEVVLSCLSEYQDGQQYDNNEWTSKYAQVVQQVPESFSESHVEFLKALAESNNLDQHIARVKEAQKLLSENNNHDKFVNEVLANLDILEAEVKEGDGAHLPFKLAAPPSQRSRWNRFWNPSWTRRGKDEDTQFEMNAILESLTNIQRDVQQIRSGISRLRYQSREVQDPMVQQHLQALSDTNWEQTTTGLYRLQQALGAAQQTNPTSQILLKMVQTASQLDINVEQIFEEIQNVQKNMYNLRLRDPVKGNASLKSATEEYGDLTQALDRLYINPLDVRSLHYSLMLHGRLEDALNARETNVDQGYRDWMNDPQSELGQGRYNMPISSPESSPNMTMESSPIVNSIQQIAQDSGVLSMLVNFLNNMATTPMSPETKQAVNTLLDALKGQPSSPSPEQPSNVVQTGNATPPTIDELLMSSNKPDTNWQTDILPYLDTLLSPSKPPATANALRKLTKVADVLFELDEDLATLLRDYISEEEEQLPEFPIISPLIKEHDR